MSCPVCQAKLRSFAIFCDTCGNKLEKGAQATISLSKTQPQTSAPNTSPVVFMLSGGALLLVGLWAGATFFSTTLMSAPREIAVSVAPENKQELKSEVVLVKEPASAPVVQAPPVIAEVAPVVVAPIGSEPTPDNKPQDGNLVDPFKKNESLKENADATLKPKFGPHSDPFVSPAKKIGDKSLDPFHEKKDGAKPAQDPDSALNPFQKKKATPGTTTPKEPLTPF